MRPRKYKRLLTLGILVWIGVILYISLNIEHPISVDDESNRMYRHFKQPEKYPWFKSSQLMPINKADSIKELNLFQMRTHEILRKDSISSTNLIGHLARPVKLDKTNLTIEQRSKYDLGWKAHAFNEYGSSLISVRRTLPDLRDPRCIPLTYSQSLPDVSVIIIFHQEAWSTLLRTVHSVIDQTPAPLLNEIILVDDNSNMTHLLDPLDSYIQKTFPEGRVIVLRSVERIGLIKARIKGATVAKGQVLVFLDSHCEAAKGWIEPLLQPIVDNNKTAVVPIIESINSETFEISNTKIRSVQIGAFDWGLIFRWFPPGSIRLKGRSNSLEPLESPTMAGGLFAIDRNWFKTLGMYDSGFKIWGGENLELSFKVWMCGGRVVTSMCSHVGHVFRQRSPYSWGPDKNVLSRNLIRLAMVWLDDFKNIYLERVSPHLLKSSIYGDITEQREIRKNLKCHDFEWYRKNVFSELFVPSESILSGAIKNMAVNYCIDSVALKPGDNVTAYQCHGKKGNQQWYMSKEHNIRRDILCLYTSSKIKPGLPKQRPALNRCPLDSFLSKEHIWSYSNNFIWHVSSNSCIELMPNNVDLFLSFNCQSRNLRQQWKWHSSSDGPQ